MTKWEKIDKNKVALEVTVEEEKVDEALDKAYRKIVGKVEVPGFRKGKVPRKILEARFGSEVLYEDALEFLVPEAYEKAIQDSEIEPIDQPDLDIKQMEAGKPLIFEAKVEVKPEVELGEYKGIEIEQIEPEISEEEVDNYLKEMQQNHSRLVVVEEGEIQEGDIAVIDFTGYIDGEAFEGGTAENYSLEIGSETFIPGFEEQLIGCKVGEEKEVKVTFPEEYQKEELAGKEAVFKVKVNEIKRKEIPPLDDDFAKEVSDFDTLEELRQDALNKLKEKAEKESRHELEDKIIQKVTENSQVEAPEVMVEKELNRILSEFTQQLRMQGLSLEQFCQLTNKTEESIKEESRSDAEQRVTGNLVLEAIINQEGITPSEDEMEEKINKMAKQYQQEPEQIREYLEAQGYLSNLEKEITLRKVIDFLVEEANIKKVKKSEVEPEEGERETEPGAEPESGEVDSL